MRNQSAFDIEKRRTELAKEFELDELRKMYKPSYPEIPDLNTSKLWDSLNLDHKQLITSNPMEDERLDLVSGLIENKEHQVLNVGFGSDNLEKVYFQKYSEVSNHWYGIDISKASTQMMRGKYPNTYFSVSNMLSMKFPKEHFDYVVAVEVLEHIPPSQTMKALSEVWRVTKPGGHFILSVPLNEGLEEMIARGENPNAHVRVYTPQLVVAELTLANFRVIGKKLLYAFHSLHALKSVIARYCGMRKWHPNNVIVHARKPDSLGCGDIKYKSG